MGIVDVTPHVCQHVRVQRAGAQIQSHRIEHEPHIAQLAVHHIESHRSGCRVLFFLLLGVAQFDTHIRIRQLQVVQRVLTFRDIESRALDIQIPCDNVDAYGVYQGVGMDRRLLHQQSVHHNRAGCQILTRYPRHRFPHIALQAQGMHVNQRILPAMADIKAVYFYAYRQIFFALVRAIENHWRMMER